MSNKDGMESHNFIVDHFIAKVWWTIFTNKAYSAAGDFKKHKGNLREETKI